MFLLIPPPQIPLNQSIVFTFHDVSINTNQGSYSGRELQYFTFHDVSINTGLQI